MAAQCGALRTDHTAQGGVVPPDKRPDDVRCGSPGDPRRGGRLLAHGGVARQSRWTLHRSFLTPGPAPKCTPSRRLRIRRTDS